MSSPSSANSLIFSKGLSFRKCRPTLRGVWVGGFYPSSGAKNCTYLRICTNVRRVSLCLHYAFALNNDFADQRTLYTNKKPPFFKGGRYIFELFIRKRAEVADIGVAVELVVIRAEVAREARHIVEAERFIKVEVLRHNVLLQREFLGRLRPI